MLCFGSFWTVAVDFYQCRTIGIHQSKAHKLLVWRHAPNSLSQSPGNHPQPPYNFKFPRLSNPFSFIIQTISSPLSSRSSSAFPFYLFSFSFFTHFLSLCVSFTSSLWILSCQLIPAVTYHLFRSQPDRTGFNLTALQWTGLG